MSRKSRDKWVDKKAIDAGRKTDPMTQVIGSVKRHE